MPYVSNKLCHFVGRSCRDDEERWSLLMKIIRSGKLLANPKDAKAEPSLKTHTQYKRIDELGEALSDIDCVCFCDIPDSELGIHTQKYSKFGIAFRKDFLVSAGTRPVHYIPKTFNMETEMKGRCISFDPAKYFVDINRWNIYSLMLLDFLNVENGDIIRLYEEKKKNSFIFQNFSDHFEENIPEVVKEKRLHQVMFAIESHCMNNSAFIKLFDPMLADDDPQNYYMEREWRCLQNVEFTLDDIVNVYMPESEIMSEIFMKQFPKLSDKIIYL